MKLVKGILLFFIAVSVFGCNPEPAVEYRQDDGTGISEGQQLGATSGWYRSAVFYHIWVKAFNDGEYDDGIGDLKGIIKKLNYIESLGATALWLSPIFECTYKGDNMHGYDTTDYYRINDRFGTSEDVKNLLDAAHAKNMKVIFDFVPNHTSVKHPWFTDSATRSSYYIWSNTNTGWYYAWGSTSTTTDVWRRYGSNYYYSAFVVDSLADLNYGNATVVTEMNNVVTYWLNRGFDGMRVDAVRYIWEDGAGLQADRSATHTFLQGFRSTVDASGSANSSAKMMVAEAWTSREDVDTYYGSGSNEFNMCFDFRGAYEIRNATVNANAYAYTEHFTWIKNNYPDNAAAFSVNHDKVVPRAMSLLGDRKRCIGSAALNIMAMGTPFIYYGEEVGMTGDYTIGDDDLKMRSNMNWSSVSSQSGNSQSILSWYKYLIAARKGNKALAEGGFNAVGSDNTVVCFYKDWGTQYVLVVVNLVNTSKTFSISGLPVTGVTAENIIGANSTNSVSGNAITITNLPAYGVRVILLSNGGQYYQTNVFAGDLN